MLKPYAVSCNFSLNSASIQPRYHFETFGGNLTRWIHFSIDFLVSTAFRPPTRPLTYLSLSLFLAYYSQALFLLFSFFYGSSTETSRAHRCRFAKSSTAQIRAGLANSGRCASCTQPRCTVIATWSANEVAMIFRGRLLQVAKLFLPELSNLIKFVATICDRVFLLELAICFLE